MKNEAAIDKVGKRKWIYAFQPKGQFYKRRTVISAIYLLLFFITPFIKIDGYPIFLFNIPDRVFILFGQIFYPHDLMLLGLVMLTALVFIVVFTLVFGRVFCGWVCPQTVFMEMVFRRIEYWIEGPAHKQRINDQKRTTEVMIRKVFKHVVFFLISFLIANTFLAYIVGVDRLWEIISEPASQHIKGLVALTVFSFVFYVVFAFVREMVCTVVCPYGRLQSVLLDKNSINVAYDYNRGEPRNKKRIKTDEPLGDCIDCGMCINVCPTGIDIRKGTQLECVNCTACIDACDDMMEKVNLPLGLITYISENQLEKKQKFSFNYRAKIYSAVLLVLLVVTSYMIFSRSMFDATLLRVPGQMYQEDKVNNTLSNLYKIKIISKSKFTEPLTLTLQEPDAEIVYVGAPIDSIDPGINIEQTFFIKVKDDGNIKRRQDYHVQILSGEKLIQTKAVTFIGKY